MSRLLDFFCFASLVGIWPRFIEPNLLQTKTLSLFLEKLPSDLENLKILQFSDLHWNTEFSRSFLKKKVLTQIDRLKPDLILFTGDFLCKSVMDDKEGLKDFLFCLKAKYGVFGILGNHDYEKFVSVSSSGTYDVVKKSSSSNVLNAFKKLFQKAVFTGELTEEAKNVPVHQELIELLKETPLVLLHNETALITIGSTALNLCGLGELSAGKFDPEKAFLKYDTDYPGIILTHNPDSIPLLRNHEGFLILSGHTHGGQINLPFLCDRFSLMIHKEYRRGLKKLEDKMVYTNRGIGAILKFRLFSPPELTLITLKRK